MKRFAGVDHLSLDQRKFDPSPEEIEGICRYFSIGNLRYFKKEKGIIVSHSNDFVFVQTPQGQYALKFYPSVAAKAITIEYAVNRLLLKHHFLTPRMYLGRGRKPFVAGNNRLAACYDFIDGKPAWQSIRQAATVRQINTSLLSIKNILSAGLVQLPLLKQPNLLSRARDLTRNSRALGEYDQKKLIESSLRQACKFYAQYKSLFTRQKLHNNASLTNFIIHQKTAYMLDLSHIREDYTLSDLASLVISCLFFNIPAPTVKIITRDHFNRHQAGPAYFPVLATLVRVGLITEYLKNIQRERSLDPSAYPPGLVRAYTTQLSKRERSIISVLKKMNHNPGLLV